MACPTGTLDAPWRVHIAVTSLKESLRKHKKHKKTSNNPVSKSRPASLPVMTRKHSTHRPGKHQKILSRNLVRRPGRLMNAPAEAPVEAGPSFGMSGVLQEVHEGHRWRPACRPTSAHLPFQRSSRGAPVEACPSSSPCKPTTSKNFTRASMEACASGSYRVNNDIL